MTRKTPRQFLAFVTDTAERLRKEIEAKVDGFPVDPAASTIRQQHALADFRFFAQTYFPHYVGNKESVLHQYLYKRLPVLAKKDDIRHGSKLAVAAPRGEAKSTLVTQLFTLWCVAGRRYHFIPIIMDAYGQAATMLEAIKAELTVNPRLRQDFPAIFGEGQVWQEGVIVTRNGIKLQAFGSCQRMRGLRHGPHRPDLVILDDLENDQNVLSRDQRDKTEKWLNRAVLNLGPPDDSMDVVMIGTVLHHDSVLSRILNNKMWESARFRAIIRWPDHLDLWESWERIFKQEGEDSALFFYRANRARMDAGAEVSWPEVRPLQALMIIRARNGRNAFDAEMQNEPLSENALFADLSFWNEPKKRWIFFGAVDPSLGKQGGRGDPSAILVAGLDRETGILDVVEADIRIRKPDRIIRDVIDYQRQYQCRLWAVETVQFQEFFKDELIKQSAAQGVPVPARGVNPINDKELRITSLQPHIANGLIRFHQSHSVLIEQLRRFGEPDSHDDGPDALHMLFTIATKQGGGLDQIQSWGERVSSRFKWHNR
ncbi:MAG: phage terminase large subunit [Magnetococcales bacterium]|nr:phage terminase large subunit [Magnetococcales bacterium]MBF0114723.1 phage terminase large subunit [Magnetococcales bacterium]